MPFLILGCFQLERNKRFAMPEEAMMIQKIWVCDGKDQDEIKKIGLWEVNCDGFKMRIGLER